MSLYQLLTLLDKQFLMKYWIVQVQYSLYS